MTTSLAPTQHRITIGIDAHKDAHWVVALDEHGVRIGDRQFPTTILGYRALLDWADQFGLVGRVGIESTGSYAAGLTRFLVGREITVIEVNSPHPHTRAKKGKDDAIDAEAAARKVLAGDATATPKTTTGAIESIRLLRVARESAVKARSVALTQLQDVLITAPGELRESIEGKAGRGKVTQCAKLRPDRAQINDPTQAAKITLRSLARRIEALDHEIDAIDGDLDILVAAAAPTLISRLGIGTGHASQLLVTAGQNIDRLHSEAAFARLCGVAPIPISSGKTHRMRLHRGGDRQANRALHMIAVCRLRYDPRTIAYMTKRLGEGLSKRDALRCLKRFIAREVFNDLKIDLTST
jgi:transposase